MPNEAYPLQYRWPRLLVGPIVGTIAGATLFALIGCITDRTFWGGVSGAAIGGIFGCGYQARYVSMAVAWICIFAAIGAFVGPSYDADAMTSALLYGAVGAWIGYTGLRGCGAFIGALVGMNVGAAGGDYVVLMGLCAGGWLGWLSMSILRQKFVHHSVRHNA